MRGLEGEWAFRVQLCRDLERQPIEDPTVEWEEDAAPFQRVATIRICPQDSWNRQRVEAVDEQMRFSVWTGLAAHQPLGNINRARLQVYRHSADFRQRFNKCRSTSRAKARALPLSAACRDAPTGPRRRRDGPQPRCFAISEDDASGQVQQRRRSARSHRFRQSERLQWPPVDDSFSLASSLRTTKATWTEPFGSAIRLPLC